MSYVPSWLKFSYLSELLVSTASAYGIQSLMLGTVQQEASMADITYLFEEVIVDRLFIPRKIAYTPSEGMVRCCFNKGARTITI